MNKETTHKNCVLNALDNNTLGVLAVCSNPTKTAFRPCAKKIGTS